MRLDRLDAGEVVTGDLRVDGGITAMVQGRDRVVIGTLLSGSRRVEGASRSHRAGDVYLAARPGASWAVHLQDAREHTVSLAASRFSAADLDELSTEPVARGAARWRRTTRLIDDLLAGDDAAAQLVVDPAAGLLAATALAVFPGRQTATDRRDGHPATLRRAIAFIDGNPERDITMSDIAVAAHVTTRAVQLAFRRHMDTTPTGYLRQVRLQHAHEQLQDARPQEGITVTAVAMRWGFANPSHFSAHYRDAYGAAPSDTLKR